MNPTSFKTISKAAEGEIFKDQGSKFIGYAFPVKTAEQAEDQVQTVRDLHPKATHHCYAYRLTADGSIYRANDDGEPSNSAGMPIYNQLLSDDLTNVLIVVVRYYGGTKLGVGGLITAYREGARLAIAEAQIVHKTITKSLKIRFPYEETSTVKRLLNTYQLETIQEEFTADCLFELDVPVAKYEEISSHLGEFKSVTIVD